jgi:hypothetical protein
VRERENHKRGNVSTLKDSSAGKETVSEALRWIFSIFQRSSRRTNGRQLASHSHTHKHISSTERERDRKFSSRRDPEQFLCTRPKFRRQEKWKRSASSLSLYRSFSVCRVEMASHQFCLRECRRTPCRPLVCLLCMFAPNRRCKDWRLEQSCLCVCEPHAPRAETVPQKKRRLFFVTKSPWPFGPQFWICMTFFPKLFDRVKK